MGAGASVKEDVNNFLRDDGKELKDTPELRKLLRSGCERLRGLMDTFNTEEVYDVLERVSVQNKIQKNAAGMHSYVFSLSYYLENSIYITLQQTQNQNVNDTGSFTASLEFMQKLLEGALV